MNTPKGVLELLSTLQYRCKQVADALKSLDGVIDAEVSRVKAGLHLFPVERRGDGRPVVRADDVRGGDGFAHTDLKVIEVDTAFFPFLDASWRGK